MIEWVVGIFLALLALFGIQTLRLNGQKKKVKKLTDEVVKEKKQTVIYKTVIEKSDEAKVEVETLTQEYDKLEEQLEKAQTQEDIISIANDIVAKFNRVQDN